MNNVPVRRGTLIFCNFVLNVRINFSGSSFTNLNRKMVLRIMKETIAPITAIIATTRTTITIETTSVTTAFTPPLKIIDW